MQDEPKSERRDADAVPPPGQEPGAVANQLIQEFPDRTHSEITAAIELARIQIAPSIEVADLIEHARMLLHESTGEGTGEESSEPQSAQPLHHPRMRPRSG